MNTSLDLSTNLLRGACLSTVTLILTAALEFCSRNEVEKLLKKKGGRELYMQAWVANLINIPVLGALTYHLTMVVACYGAKPMSIIDRLVAVSGIIAIEGLLYAICHKAFHEVNGLWWAHRFHHKFNDIILPSSANAVSMTEFTFAYMLPIIAGAVITGADELSGIMAVVVIGVTNLMIHTPFLLDHKLPWYLVSTKDHFRHHRLLAKDYSAPLIHFERIIESSASTPRNKSSASSN